MNQHYSQICSHPRLTRLDANFVRCLNCGQSLVNQKAISKNKTSKDFVKENKSFGKNFSRNFSNEIEQVEKNPPLPIIEYYADERFANVIILNRNSRSMRQPVEYEIIINGNKTFLTNEQISKLLTDIKAIRLTKEQILSRIKLTK